MKGPAKKYSFGSALVFGQRLTHRSARQARDREPVPQFIFENRKASLIFGQWVGEILSADNKRQLWVPQGFAHGFLVLSDTAEVLYKTSDYYAPELERCKVWNDAILAIDWPVRGACMPG